MSGLSAEEESEGGEWERGEEGEDGARTASVAGPGHRRTLLVPAPGSGAEGLSTFLRPPGLPKQRVSLRRCPYPVLGRVVRDLRWPVTKTPNDEGASVLWIDRFLPEQEFRRMQGARMNHFPAMREICNKVPMGRHLNRMQAAMPDLYDFFPPTFAVPADRRRLERFWEIVQLARSRSRGARGGKGPAARPLAGMQVAGFVSAAAAAAAAGGAGGGAVGRSASPLVSAIAAYEPIVPWWLDLSQVVAIISKPDTECQGRGIQLHGDLNAALRAAGVEVTESGGGGQRGGRRRRAGDGSDQDGKGGADSSDSDDSDDDSDDEDDSDDDSGSQSSSGSGSTGPERAMRVLLQSYLPRPVLLGGFKFDLRIYAVVTSVFPSLRLFLHRDGLCRLATCRYEEPSGGKGLKQRRRHLTNHAVNKGHALEGGRLDVDHSGPAPEPVLDPTDCGDGDDRRRGQGMVGPPDSHEFRLPRVLLERTEATNKWSVRSLLAELEAQGYDTEALWDGIKDITAKTVISTAPLLAHEYACAAPGGVAALRAASDAADPLRSAEQRSERPGAERISERSGAAPERQSSNPSSSFSFSSSSSSASAPGEQGFRCFEVLGLDILLIEPPEHLPVPPARRVRPGKRLAVPVLLEFNQLPSFGTDTPLDEEVKRRVIGDAMALIGPDEHHLAALERRARASAGLPLDALDSPDTAGGGAGGAGGSAGAAGAAGAASGAGGSAGAGGAGGGAVGAASAAGGEDAGASGDEDEDEGKEDGGSSVGNVSRTTSSSSTSKSKRWVNALGRLAREIEEGATDAPPLDSCLTALALTQHAARTVRRRRLWEEWCLRAPWYYGPDDDGVEMRAGRSPLPEGEVEHCMGSGLERVLPPPASRQDLRDIYERILAEAPEMGPRTTATLERRRALAVRKRKLLQLRLARGFQPRFGLGAGATDDLDHATDAELDAALRALEGGASGPAALSRAASASSSASSGGENGSSSAGGGGGALGIFGPGETSAQRATKTAAAAERARKEEAEKEKVREERRNVAVQRRLRREAEMRTRALERLREALLAGGEDPEVVAAAVAAAAASSLAGPVPASFVSSASAPAANFYPSNILAPPTASAPPAVAPAVPVHFLGSDMLPSAAHRARAPILRPTAPFPIPTVAMHIAPPALPPPSAPLPAPQLPRSSSHGPGAAHTHTHTHTHTHAHSSHPQPPHAVIVDPGARVSVPKMSPRSAMAVLTPTPITGPTASTGAAVAVPIVPLAPAHHLPPRVPAAVAASAVADALTRPRNPAANQRFRRASSGIARPSAPLESAGAGVLLGFGDLAVEARAPGAHPHPHASDADAKPQPQRRQTVQLRTKTLSFAPSTDPSSRALF